MFLLYIFSCSWFLAATCSNWKIFQGKAHFVVFSVCIMMMMMMILCESVQVISVAGFSSIGWLVGVILTKGQHL